jgi:DNA-binding transcriptional ArsR family regulator
LLSIADFFRLAGYSALMIATTLNSSCVIFNISQAAHMINEKLVQQVLKWLLTTTKGGNTRTQILKTLKQNPQNTNQLATTLKKSYKTISYHLEILKKYKMVLSIGDKYAATYFLTNSMEENYPILQEITKTKKQ